MSQATHLNTVRRLLFCLPMEALPVLASCVCPQAGAWRAPRAVAWRKHRHRLRPASGRLGDCRTGACAQCGAPSKQGRMPPVVCIRHPPWQGHGTALGHALAHRQRHRRCRLQHHRGGHAAACTLFRLCRPEPGLRQRPTPIHDGRALAAGIGPTDAGVTVGDWAHGAAGWARHAARPLVAQGLGRPTAPAAPATPHRPTRLRHATVARHAPSTRQALARPAPSARPSCVRGPTAGHAPKTPPRPVVRAACRASGSRRTKMSGVNHTGHISPRDSLIFLHYVIGVIKKGVGNRRMGSL
jgi:hypothetical protein